MTIEQAKQLGPVAHTSAGWVLGGAREGVEIYRGIPYGANCEGERRFLPPVAAQAWEGVRDCRRTGLLPCNSGAAFPVPRDWGPISTGDIRRTLAWRRSVRGKTAWC